MDTKCKKMLVMAGYTPTKIDYDPVIEGDLDEGYIKFMSDHGVTDKAQAAAVKEYMEANGAVIKGYVDRSFTFRTEDFERIFPQFEGFFED